MKQPRVTVVLVNWRRREETCLCLRSLEHLDFPCQIIVVDNGSGDGSGAYLASRFPQVTLIQLDSNVGFAAACNRAITRALADSLCDYIFLLNNDTIVHRRALSELLRAAGTYPKAGILGSKVFYRDRPRMIWYAGARVRPHLLAFTDTGRGHVDRGQFGRVRYVDCVFGAAMLIRRNVFDSIGLFDERFFLYLEDLDFCLRAREAGFSLLFVPQSLVWHKGCGSTVHLVALRRYHMVKSTIHFLHKHIPLHLWLPALGVWSLSHLPHIVADLRHGELGVLRSCWSGLVKGLAETRAAGSRMDVSG
jgi:GT2 family glycosyltransferase